MACQDNSTVMAVAAVKQKRPIRSYVKRQGRITVAQQKALTEQWDRFGLTVGQGRLDLERVFGRVAPTVLEIGFGNGLSLLQMAKQRSDINFIGIEVHQPGVGALLNGMSLNDVGNIRIFQQDAIDVLKQSIEPGSLSKIQIFFPDPWPKKKHHKRRLIQVNFIDLIYSLLQPGGELHMATDWQPYAEQMMEVMSAQPAWKNSAGVGQYTENAGLRPVTKFEQRGRRLGHGVWDLIFSTQ